MQRRGEGERRGGNAFAGCCTTKQHETERRVPKAKEGFVLTCFGKFSHKGKEAEERGRVGKKQRGNNKERGGKKKKK